MHYLVFDYGLAVTHAARLIDGGKNQVRYFIPWGGDYPKFQTFAPGMNFDGLEKVYYFFENIEWADCIVFFDVGTGDICNYLRKTTKKPIYGASLGERLENHRALLKKIQEKIGLPIQHYEIITGVPKLREYLKKHEKKYVKLDIFRGDIESFYAETYDKCEMKLDEIEVQLGPFNDEYEFVVEDFIEGIEPGFDLFFDGNQFCKPYLWGFQHEHACYLGKFETGDLPKPIQLVADKLEPVLRTMDYRGAISTEIRLTKEQVPYLIDVTARFPYPLSALYTQAIKNFPEVIYNIAQKKPVRLDVDGQYVAALPLETPYAKEHWMRLDFDHKLRPFVKTRKAAEANGVYYGVPGMPAVYILVNSGDNYTKVLDSLTPISDKVEAYELEKDGVGVYRKLYDVIDKCETFGLGKF